MASAQAQAKRLQNLPKDLQKILVQSINRTGQATKTQANRAIRADIRLSASYISSLMQMHKASPNRLRFVLSVRRRAVQLSRFAPSQLVKKAISPKRRLKGHQRRGIPRGLKSAGVSVNVYRNTGRQKLRHTFLMDLKSGNLGLVEADGLGGYRVLYGPSPAQRFGARIDQLSQQAQHSLTKEFSRRIKTL